MKPAIAQGTVLLAALSLLAGCAATSGLQPRASLSSADRLAASSTLKDVALSPAGWPTRDWWKRFNDPQLDRLIEEALRGNASLRVAEARVRKALAAAGLARAAEAPQVTGSADSTRERLSQHGLVPPPFGGAWVTLSNLTANLSYELDLWHRNRSAYEAALDEAHAADVDAYAARLMLSSAIARAYVQLQRAYEQLDLAQATLKQREQIRSLIEQRFAAGLDTQIDLKQAQAALPEVRERIASLKESIALTQNLLAALLGEGPDRGLKITRPHLQASGYALPSQLPADLIGRRPDIVAQRWRVEAARKDIDVARAQFYPNVNLLAFLGLQGIALQDFLQAGNTTVGAGPALRLPIFDGGRLRANLAGTNASFDIAVEQYNQTLVDALHDVVDQVTSLRSVDEQRAELGIGLKTVQDAYDLAVLRYKEGLGNYLQVLAAESQVLAQKSLAVDVSARALDLAVNLMRALGGGYEDEAARVLTGVRK